MTLIKFFPAKVTESANWSVMEKLTEKLLLERCTPKTTKLEQIKTLNLSKLGLRCPDLPVPLLSRLQNLEQLDLSGNRLEEVPRVLCLPSLRTLDLSNNDMEDVTTLASLTSLEELKMEDNLYITVTDDYKLLILLPKLRVYNGKDISTTANHIRYVSSEILRTRVVAVWETNFSLPDPPTAEKLATVEKKFVNAARQQVKYGPSSLSDYTKWRVEMIAKEYLRSLMEPNKEDGETEEPADTKENCSVSTPTKRKRTASASECTTASPQRKAKASAYTPTLAEASPRKSSRLHSSTPQKVDRTTTASPRKAAAQTPASPLRRGQREQQPKGLDATPQPQAERSRTPAKCARVQGEINRKPGLKIYSKSQEPVSLKPVHVLQCHSKRDSPDDFSTQLWACAFQPPADNSADGGGGTRVVATCGGESLCLIDCETGLVMKKYKVSGEEFFSLAWSTVLMSQEGAGCVRPCSILAAGGKRGVVKLLHPRANMAYGEFRASRKSLSTLRFSPRQGNFLYTGSYDNKIVMWDIGGVDKEYNFKVIQLLVLETSSTPLHLCLPPATPDTHLLAACEEGLQCYDIQLNKNTMKRSAEMEITFPVYKKEDKHHNYHTIDGLGFLTDDIVASKCHMQGAIYLWSWSGTRAQHPNKKKKEVCAVILAELQWSSTEIPYLSLATCPSAGYVVCGDDKGRLWTYHVSDVLQADFKSGKPISATEVLAWPSPVSTGKGPVEGPSINSVAMDPDLRYLVALSDKNMAVVWKRVES